MTTKLDLSTDYCGIKLRNPLITAAGPTGWCAGRIANAWEYGAGAVTTQSITDKLRKNPTPFHRFHKINPSLGLTPSNILSMVNINYYAVHDLEYWKEALVQLKGVKNPPIIIANIMATSYKKLDDIIKSLIPVNVDAIELGVSCPFGEGLLESTEKEIVGAEPTELINYCTFAHEVRGRYMENDNDEDYIPLIVKMSPHIPPSKVRKTVKRIEPYVDGFSAIDCLKGLPPGNIETRHPGLISPGGISGPALSDSARWMVREIRRATTKPISAVGGISRAMDAIDLIMHGATTFQINTAIIAGGLSVIPEILRGLETYMLRHKLNSYEECLKEIGGCYHNYYKDFDEIIKEIDREMEGEQDKVVNINQSRCIGYACDKPCSDTLCTYGGFKIEGSKFKAVPSECRGCGTCEDVCSFGVFSLQQNPEIPIVFDDNLDYKKLFIKYLNSQMNLSDDERKVYDYIFKWERMDKEKPKIKKEIAEFFDKQKEVNRSLYINRSQVYKILIRLEEKNLLKFRYVPTNQSHQVYLNLD